MKKYPSVIQWLWQNYFIAAIFIILVAPGKMTRELLISSVEISPSDSIFVGDTVYLTWTNTEASIPLHIKSCSNSTIPNQIDCAVIQSREYYQNPSFTFIWNELFGVNGIYYVCVFSSPSYYSCSSPIHAYAVPSPIPTAAPSETRIDYLPFGIQVDFECDPVTGLSEGDWVLVYNAPYSDPTTSTDITQQNYSVSKYPYMCVAAFRSDAATDAALMACGERSDIEKNTYLTSTAYYSNGAYWYFYEGQSFGFSPESYIDLNSADIADLAACDDNNGALRLSWHIDQSIGGYRAGCSAQLNNDEIWTKKIFLGQLPCRNDSSVKDHRTDVWNYMGLHRTFFILSCGIAAFQMLLLICYVRRRRMQISDVQRLLLSPVISVSVSAEIVFISWIEFQPSAARWIRDNGYEPKYAMIASGVVLMEIMVLVFICIKIKPPARRCPTLVTSGIICGEALFVIWSISQPEGLKCQKTRMWVAASLLGCVLVLLSVAFWHSRLRIWRFYKKYCAAWTPADEPLGDYKPIDSNVIVTRALSCMEESSTFAKKGAFISTMYSFQMSHTRVPLEKLKDGFLKREF